jgi:hypothetical protein
MLNSSGCGLSNTKLRSTKQSPRHDGQGGNVPTERQLQNLKRGGVKPGTPENARKARERKAMLEAERQRFGQLASEDAFRYLDELHGLIGRQTVRLLQAEERERAKPHRETTDRLRELRVLTETLVAYRNSRTTQEADAARFFTTLEDRVRTIVAMEGEDFDSLVAKAQPIAETEADD